MAVAAIRLLDLAAALAGAGVLLVLGWVIGDRRALRRPGARRR
jgi:hypothetical protein